MAQNRRRGRRSGAAREQLDGNAGAIIGFTGPWFRNGCGNKFGARQSSIAAAQPGRAGGVANHQRRRYARQQSPQVFIGKSIIERTIGHARNRRAKQRQHRCLTRFVEQGNMGAARLVDQRRCAARTCQQLRISPATIIADQRNPVSSRVSGHFKKQGNIHQSRFNPTPATAWRP